MLRKEFVKTAIRLKGIGLILLLACAVTLIRMQNPAIYNIMLEYHKAEYLQIGQQYGLEGKYSEEKRQILDQLYEENEKQLEQREQIVNAYLKGMVKQVDYIQQMKNTEHVYEEKDVLEQYLIQYETAAKSPEQYYVMYGNGWCNLFCLPYGYLSMLAAVMIAVFLWMPEFESRNCFFDFMITTKLGRGAIVTDKGILMFGAIALECGIEQLLYGMYLAEKYGIMHGNWPAQSLAVLDRFIFPVSIFQAVVLLGLCRFGMMYLLAVYTSLLVLLMKQIQPVLAAVGSLIIFGGIRYWEDDMLLRIFDSHTESIGYGVVCILLILFGNLYLRRIWSGRMQYEKNFLMKKMPYVICLWAGILILFLGGIAAWLRYTGIISGITSDAGEEKALYNGFSSQWIQDGKEYVSFYSTGDSQDGSISESNNEKTALYEKKTGNIYDFQMNPLIETENYEKVYPYGDGFWFIETKGFDYSVNYYDKQFNKKQVYKVRQGYSLINQISGDKEGGGMDLVSSMEAIDRMPVQFVVTQNQLFYLSRSGIWKHDLRWGKETQVVKCNYASPYLSYQGRELYYLDSDFILRSYNIDTGNSTSYQDIFTDQFVVSEQGIVFNNLMDKRELYWFDRKTENSIKLDAGSSEAYDLEEDVVYYVKAGILYWKKLGKEEGGKIKEVSDSAFSLKKISDMALIGCAITNQNHDIEIKFIEFNRV